jgi:hypothetical protein
MIIVFLIRIINPSDHYLNERMRMIPNRTTGSMNTPRQSSFSKLTVGLRLYIRREMAMKVNKTNKVVDFLL